MSWDVEFTDEFEAWWDGLSLEEQESISFSVELLMEYGPNLKHPHSSGIGSSRHGHMRELRSQHQGRPYRTLYAFNPKRTAILLIAGDKTWQNDWYEINVPVADHLYDIHLEELKREGEI